MVLLMISYARVRVERGEGLGVAARHGDRARTGGTLRLTPAGQRAADNLAAARQERFSRLPGSTPAHEREGVIHALEILTEALDE
jgi:DNA-binding MarR family transcriptional regulator